MTLVWVDAPPQRMSRGRKPILTAEQATELRSRPGAWAQVETFPSCSSAHQARKRWADRPGDFPKGEWEVQARRFSDGTSAVYARFVGEGFAVGEAGPGSGAPASPTTEELEEPAEEPLEDRTCPSCGEVKETVHGLRVHVGRKHKGQLAGLSDGEGGVLESVAVAAALEAPAVEGIPQPVGMINGVCGPCRRGRCQFCAAAGCGCRRPGHFAHARATAS